MTGQLDKTKAGDAAYAFMDDPLGGKGSPSASVKVDGFLSVTDHQDTGLLASAMNGTGNVVVQKATGVDKFTMTSAATTTAWTWVPRLRRCNRSPRRSWWRHLPALGRQAKERNTWRQTAFVGTTYTVVHGTYTLEGITDVKLTQKGGPEPEGKETTAAGLSVYTYIPDPLGVKGAGTVNLTVTCWDSSASYGDSKNSQNPVQHGGASTVFAMQASDDQRE